MIVKYSDQQLIKKKTTYKGMKLLMTFQIDRKYYI